MSRVANGPIERYMQRTQLSQEHFDKEVAKGSVTATIVFVADILFGAIHDVAVSVENK